MFRLPLRRRGDCWSRRRTSTAWTGRSCWQTRGRPGGTRRRKTKGELKCTMLYYFSGGFEIIIFTLLETAFDSGHFLGLSLHQVMLRYIGFKRGEKTAILPPPQYRHLWLLHFSCPDPTPFNRTTPIPSNQRVRLGLHWSICSNEAWTSGGTERGTSANMAIAISL